MAAPVGIELAEDVVEEQERRPAVELREEVELGQLEGQDRGPLLAARRERGQVAAGLLEDHVVAVGPDERGAVPDLPLGRLGQAPLERVPGRLPGRGRRVRRVAEAAAARRPPRPVRSRRGPGRAGRRAPRGAPAARRRSRRRRRGSSRPRTGARPGRRPPRGSPAGASCAAGARARTSTGRAGRPPSAGRRARRGTPGGGRASRPRGASPPARRRPSGAGRPGRRPAGRRR